MSIKRSLTILTVTLFLLTISFAGLATAGEKKAPPWPPHITNMVKEAKKSVNVIDMEAFKAVVDNKGDAIILDVREPNEFKSGHAPGAINIPRGVLEFKVWKAVAGYPGNTKTDLKIYTYCKLGGRGILAAKTLKEIGFTDVTAVGMKVADWVKAGYPIER